jgi:hypothetical protein
MSYFGGDFYVVFESIVERREEVEKKYECNDDYGVLQYGSFIEHMGGFIEVFCLVYNTEAVMWY